MATRVKYKFGDDEFDLKDYIHNLETNYQSYVASKNWNEGQQQEFKNAFDKYLTGLKDQLSNNTGRFYTDYSGAIFDNKGEFSNTDDDNIDPVGSEYYYNNKGQRITTDDYNLLRKRKQKNFNTFSANRQVATYLNKVGIALRDYSKQNPSNNSSNAFNLSKHGFEKYWMDQNNPSGGDFDFAPYVEKDQIGEGGVRGTSNRAAYLKEQLENYIKNLGDYDFSSTTFKDKDTYLAKLRAAMENLDNGYNHEDAIALNQAGLSSSFLNNFFGTGEQQQKSEVEQAAKYIAAEQKRQQDQEIIDQAARMKAMSELDQWAKDNQFQPKYSGVLEGGDYDPDAILSMLEKDYADIEGDDNKVKAWLNFEQLLKDIREPMIEADAIINGQPVSTIEGSKAAMRKLRANLAQKLKFAAQEGYMKAYGDEYIIPGSEDYSNYSLITYNPVTGEYKDQSVILNEKLREAMAYDWYKKNTSVPSNKNGGALYYLQQGGFMQRQREVRKQREEQQKQEQTQQSTKSKDEDTRTPEQRKAGERVPKSGELSTIDKVRIGSAITDIGSILAAFVPGYGTAASAIAGLGSTGANLYADISDDSVSGWQAAGNAGFGLLMDVAGLIPGLGAVGKAGKIAKTLKYVLPTALTIWGVSENGGDAIKAANKLMNGRDLTVDDWKALSFGLQTIAGGTRAVKGNKSVNRQLKNTKEKAPYKTITAESGKTYKVTPEQFKQITSATTLEAQNKAFREAIGSGNSSERLGSKFKTSRWERVRHPFTAEPKTGGGVDYIDRSLDISTMERIPWQFKVNNGQLTPRRLSNEWLLQKTGRWTFGDPTINWFTRKNPLYNKQSSAPTVSTPQIKPSIRPGSGPNIRQLRMWNRTPGYARAQGYGRDFGVGDTRNSREISLGIEFDKQGGILKYQDGNVLTPTGRAGVRKKDTYTFNTTNRLQSVLNKIKKGEITVDDANEFQRRHYTMYSQWTQQPMQGQSVSLYQTDYNNQGWNDEIIAPGFTNNYDIQSTNPTSGDSIVGNWTIDGIYDQITDDRRVMARDSDYKDQASRDADIKLAEQAGFEYYLDPETRYWMLKEKPRKDEGQVSPPRQVSEPVKNEPVAEEEPIVENSKANNNILRTILGNPTITYGLPRAVYADRMNRRMTDLAKESVTPLLKDPFQVHRYTRSDLDAEMQGERNYADLRRLASRPITSDGSLQTATQLQAEVQGQEARTAGKEKSNQTQRQYDELAWQQEKENAANRHETAMFNRAQQWGADQDKSKFEQAYLSKKFNIWDTFGQQLEFEARSRQQESKAIADRFAYSDIQNTVNSDPNRYGAGLTEEELALHKRLQAGIAPSQLISENNNNVTLLSSIRQKLSQAQQAQLSQYYNINPSKWAGVRSAQKPQEIIITRAARKGAKLAKNGSKIAIAGIEAKTADAERFQRQIKDCIDRNEKTLDRLSKSLYGLIKASMIK